MIAVLALLLLQDADLGAKLKSGGWAAVEKADPKDKAKLEELAKSDDKELQWWAGAALAELDAREKAGSAWVEPLLVTVEETGKPAHLVLEALLAKAGARLGPEPWAGPDVTLTLKDAPLLEAIDAVCLQADVALFSTSRGEYTPQQGGSGKGPRFYHGPFSVKATATTRRTDVSFKEAPSSSLHVGLHLQSDPRVRIMAMAAEPQIVRAVDDTGRDLAPRARGPGAGLRFASVHGTGGQAVDVVLDPPPRAAKKIALLRGIATATLAKKVEAVIFDKVASGEPQSREIGGIKVQMKKCAREGDRWTLSLEMASSGSPSWPDTQEIVLEDASGAPLQAWGSSSSRHGGRATYELSYRAEGSPPPARARFPVVTETCTRRICFELKDVPLP